MAQKDDGTALPGTQLLRLLDKFNINAGTIYPGYNSVMASIREREFYG